jgi:hypothetical protein
MNGLTSLKLIKVNPATHCLNLLYKLTGLVSVVKGGHLVKASGLGIPDSGFSMELFYPEA